MASDLENHHKPNMHRDIQIIIGEQITAGLHGKIIHDGLFNLLFTTPTIRAAALKRLAKFTIFTLNSCQAKLASREHKDSLYIDFSKISGYLYLKRLISEVVEYNGKFFTEIYFLSFRGIDLQRLLDIIQPLKGITVMSLPYEFGNYQLRKLERFIQNNGDTLLALKHITLPMAIPLKMKQRLKAINSATLRTGTLEKEQDFYAYYAEGANIPESLGQMETCKDGILMQISIHRHIEPFRAAKRAFNNSKSSNGILSQISIFKFISTWQFDKSSTQSLLAQLANSRSYFPNLKKLEFNLRLADCYPNNFPMDDDEIDEYNHVSMMATDALMVSNRTLAWLQGQKELPFYVCANVTLAVDYLVGDHETSYEVLETAMNETKLFFGQRLPADIEWSRKDGMMCKGASVQQINEKAEFHFVLEYRSLVVSKINESNGIKFEIGHTL